MAQRAAVQRPAASNRVAHSREISPSRRVATAGFSLRRPLVRTRPTLDVTHRAPPAQPARSAGAGFFVHSPRGQFRASGLRPRKGAKPSASTVAVKASYAS